MPWVWKIGSDGKRVCAWVDEEREPAHFMSSIKRRLGFEVPEPVSRFTPYLELVARGQRPRRPPSVHHTAVLNGRTGLAHSQDRAARRRLRQRERAADGDRRER